ncbi:hypothetical protein GLW20_12475 [Virgibacillus halodenitrificans]|nr:hypothetical protein [Virgibacillus halodenitrificans]
MERDLSGFLLLPTPFKLLKPLDDVAGAKKAAEVGRLVRVQVNIMRER